MHRLMVLILATTLLSACETAPRSVIVKCPTVVEYSKADEKKAADEIVQYLPPGSFMREHWVPDSITLRDQARSCAKK